VTKHRVILKLAPASDGGLFENVDQAPVTSPGYASNATDEDMERAISAARRAFHEGTWATYPESRLSLAWLAR